MKQNWFIKNIALILIFLCMANSSVAQDKFLARFKEIYASNGWKVSSVVGRNKNIQASFIYFTPNGYNGRGFAGLSGPKSFNFRFKQVEKTSLIK